MTWDDPASKPLADVAAYLSRYPDPITRAIIAVENDRAHTAVALQTPGKLLRLHFVQDTIDLERPPEARAVASFTDHALARAMLDD